MSIQLTVLALVTGLLTGALFSFLNVPIPAPPNISGVLGVIGIYLGYVGVQAFGVGVDLLDMLGI